MNSTDNFLSSSSCFDQVVSILIRDLVIYTSLERGLKSLMWENIQSAGRDIINKIMMFFKIHPGLESKQEYRNCWIWFLQDQHEKKKKNRGKCIIPVEQGLIHHFLPDQNTTTVQMITNQSA
jgi:hypothetical protein